jgi:hypothetical protein
MKQRYFIGLIFLFSLLRIVLAAVIGLMPQDAYYCYYGENLSLSYFDHPPMIAYLLRLAITLFGKSVFALHAVDFICTSGTLIFTYLFLKRLLNKDHLRKSFMLIVTAPFISLLCINSTPDVPLLFFWSLSLWLIHKAVTGQKWYYWLCAGLTSGMAFDSKYTAVFLGFGLFVFLLWNKEYRKLLFSWQFLLYIAAFIAVITPVLLWNIRHDFISIKYQSTERATDLSGSSGFQPRLFLGYFGCQLAIALPLFFLLIFKASFDLIRQSLSGKTIATNRQFAASFAIPYFLCFTAIAFVYWVKINWLMPVYLTAAILAVPYLKTWKAIYWQTGFSVLLHIVTFVELVWMPVPVHSDDTWWGWDKLATEIKTVKNQHPGYFVFSDDSYKISAALNFYLPEHVYAGNLIERHAFQFALNDRNLQPLTGRNALYITSELSQKKRRYEEKSQSILQRRFTSVHQLNSIVLKDNHGVIRRKFAVFECKGYLPPTGNKLYP